MFLETIRIENGKMPLLDRHEKRIFETQHHHFHHFSFPISQYIEKLNIPQHGVHKLKVTYEKKPTSVEISTYNILSIQKIKLVDIQFNYRFKFQNRQLITSEVKKLGSNVIPLFTKDNLLTDTHIHNIALSQNGQWFTPSHPLLDGVRRQHLLSKNRIIQRDILKCEIFSFDFIKCFNAMITFDQAPTLPIDGAFQL